MRIGILGTGDVGRTLGTGCVELEHNVTLGSRTADNKNAAEWAAKTGGSHGTFAEAVADADLVINATAGTVSMSALDSTGAGSLDGKTILDVANPLDFSQGFPPRLSVSNDDSLGEQIQAAFPASHVVKSLNTLNCQVMVNPGLIGAPTNIFVAGNDEASKATVRKLLEQFGWASEDILDLGDISAARALEMYLPLWLRIMGATGSPDFNISVVSAST